MPKFRVRANGAKNRIRYPKGMSSEANPQRNRHRSAANAARAASVQQQGMVAVDDREMLPTSSNAGDAIVDQLNLETMSIGMNGPSSSSKSMVSEGGMSAFSQFTTCTNPNFDAVHRVWRSGSSMQSEVVAVLAAVAEIIKEKGGAETDVEYMGALLVAIEGAPRDEPRRIAATAYLLHLIIKKVPREILQANFRNIVNVIYRLLLEHEDTDESSILKNLLVVLGVTLRAQTPAVWAFGDVKNMLVSICQLSTHERPWVRTMARKVTRALLTDPVTALDNGLHPASNTVATFVLKELQSSLAVKSDILTPMRYLCLLEGFMHKTPAVLFKQLAETILRSFSIADSAVKCSAMQCLERALERQPSDAALDAETTVLLVESIRSLAPPASDITVMVHWMETLVRAQVCLSAKDSDASFAILSDTIACLVKNFSSGSEELAKVTYKVMCRLIECCIQDNEEAAKALLGTLHSSLQVQSAPVWKFVVRTQMKLFETAGTAVIGQELADTLRTLAELRQSDTCLCRTEIDFTVGSAIRHVGAGPVLSVIGLQLDPDASVLPLDLPRSWLIPVLRVNLHKAPLSLFLKYFLPIAIKIHRRLPELEALPARLYTTLQQQLWDLLPHFLENPSDFEAIFPALAPILGTAIQERKDLRMVVMSGLRAALKFAQQPDAPSERAATMERFAKNFQPLLFNLYTAGGEEDYDDRTRRLAALETIRAYADVTPRDSITRYIENALTKVVEAEGDSSKQSRILDVLAALVRNANAAATAKLLENALPWAVEKATKNRTHLQKKGYKIVEEVLKRSAEPDLEELFSTVGPALLDAVMRPANEVVAQARHAQMAAVRSVIAACSDYNELKQLAVSIVPNILAMLDKANSTPTRSQASKALQEACAKLVSTGADNGESASTVMGPLLLAIFAQTTPTAGGRGAIPQGSAQGALVALNIIAQKQLKTLNSSHSSQLISQAATWMSDDRPPVKVLAIRLLRVLLQKMSDFMISQFRELVLSTFFAQNTAESTVKIRKANRLLLAKIMERLGSPIVQKAAGDKEEWIRLIKSIDKQKRRKEKAKNGPKSNEEDDEDNDDAVSTATSRTSGRTAGADTILALLEDSDDEEEDKDSEVQSRVSRRSSVWLKEDEEGAPIDLLNRKHLVQKITTTDPLEAARKRAKDNQRRENNRGYDMNKDGKIVVNVEEDTKWKRRKTGEEKEDEERPEKKRRVERDSDEESDDGEGKTAVSGWRPGGKGIHRDTRSVVSGASRVTGVSRASTAKTANGRKKGKNDKGSKAQGKNVQPYAYVPLKNMRKGGQGKQELKTLLGRKRKAPRGPTNAAALGL